jgi:hypothetical protein
MAAMLAVEAGKWKKVAQLTGRFMMKMMTNKEVLT